MLETHVSIFSIYVSCTGLRLAFWSLPTLDSINPGQSLTRSWLPPLALLPSRFSADDDVACSPMPIEERPVSNEAEVVAILAAFEADDAATGARPRPPICWPTLSRFNSHCTCALVLNSAALVCARSSLILSVSFMICIDVRASRSESPAERLLTSPSRLVTLLLSDSCRASRCCWEVDVGSGEGVHSRRCAGTMTSYLCWDGDGIRSIS